MKVHKDSFDRHDSHCSMAKSNCGHAIRRYACAICKNHQRSTNREVFELFYDFGQNLILFKTSGVTLELYNHIVNLIVRGNILNIIIDEVSVACILSLSISP